VYKRRRGLMERGQLYHSYWVALEDARVVIHDFVWLYSVLTFGAKLYTLDTSGISEVAPWSQLLRWSPHVRNVYILKEIRFFPLCRHHGSLVHFLMMLDVMCVLCACKSGGFIWAKDAGIVLNLFLCEIVLPDAKVYQGYVGTTFWIDTFSRTKYSK